ncbi:hypothetical protein [Maribacter flavus]|uniref:Terminase n=1 Tax=Maribacter flavus TaxID=1658664 RepID=A0A5B2TWT8_9FLAO|nr:hypothetical protein [Maribacter flavus]KAA2218255.1 hypothetical protein F0361_01145 [Maribacter flavus]
MSRKTHVSHKDIDVEGRFATWIKMAIDLISPKDLMFVGGRGTSKTSDIIAERSMDIIYDMPGSYQVFVADTYVNALKNVVPTLLEGWERKGWREGTHYVTDARPPAHFELPYKPVQNYKHTISVFNGCFFNLVSMDQPTGSAGNSYQHIFGDEVRYTDPDKLKKLTPALRGEYTRFGHSVYYRGRTFTTDMPNVAEGDYDWILEEEKNMDREQIETALQAALVMNEIKKELYNAIKDNNRQKVQALKRNLIRWTERWVRCRRDSTFFFIVSSYVNVDVLTDGFFTDSLKALGIEEFKASILSLKAELKKGEKFYVNLQDHHFYHDGVISEYYNKFAIGEKIEESSLALRYIDHNAPLDAGMDFGNMCSMVLGQELGRDYYVFKNMYTLAPESSKELAIEFLDFFKHHKTKILNLYYDRSGNQYQKLKKDWATEIQDHIEKMNGEATGWKVNLMNRNQATIFHSEEFNYAKKLMGEYYDQIPRLKICRYQCRELKSSLELAKTKVKKNTRTGSNEILKDKSSEDLPLKKLPMFSTNFSDAFKYLMWRKKWVKITNDRKRGTMTAPSVVGD